MLRHSSCRFRQYYPSRGTRSITNGAIGSVYFAAALRLAQWHAVFRRCVTNSNHSYKRLRVRSDSLRVGRQQDRTVGGSKHHIRQQAHAHTLTPAYTDQPPNHAPNAPYTCRASARSCSPHVCLAARLPQDMGIVGRSPKISTAYTAQSSRGTSSRSNRISRIGAGTAP